LALYHAHCPRCNHKWSQHATRERAACLTCPNCACEGISAEYEPAHVAKTQGKRPLFSRQREILLAVHQLGAKATLLSVANKIGTTRARVQSSVESTAYFVVHGESLKLTADGQLVAINLLAAQAPRGK
jgi:hypothetical protein